MSALTVTGATKTYPGALAPVLSGVDLTLTPGEAFVILGATGSGKSTLLRSIAGLEQLDSGTITVQGQRLAMVFQQPGLFPWLNVRQNIELGTGYSANSGTAATKHIDALLSTLGLTHLADAPVSSLSGGQAQRVAIGRALAIQPSLLLLDEPFSALDPATKTELQTWLRGLIEQLGLTVLMVSHDIKEALTIADRIGFFEADAGFTRSWEPRTANVTEQEILAHYRPAADHQLAGTGAHGAA